MHRLSCILGILCLATSILFATDSIKVTNILLRTAEDSAFVSKDNPEFHKAVNGKVNLYNIDFPDRIKVTDLAYNLIGTDLHSSTYKELTKSIKDEILLQFQGIGYHVHILEHSDGWLQIVLSDTAKAPEGHGTPLGVPVPKQSSFTREQSETQKSIAVALQSASTDGPKRVAPKVSPSSEDGRSVVTPKNTNPYHTPAPEIKKSEAPKLEIKTPEKTTDPTAKKVPAPKPKVSTPQASKATPTVKSDKPAIAGIVFVTTISEVKARGYASLGSLGNETITFKDMNIPLEASLRLELAPFIGTPSEFSNINEIIATVVDHFSREGRDLIDVFLPEQAFRAGILQLVVAEAKLDDITVEGNKWFDADRIIRLISLEAGQAPNTNKLEKDLRWLNKNPFRKVDAVFEPGTDPGTTNLKVVVEDKIPLRGFVGANNAGNKLTGDWRIFGGLNLGNVMRKEHEMGVQLTGDIHYKHIKAFSINYIVPVNQFHDKLRFSGSHSRSEADFANPALNNFGRSWQALMSYVISLPDLKKMEHNFELGFDFKRSNNSFDISQIRISDTTTDVGQFFGKWSGSRADKWGGTTFSLASYLSAGHLIHNQDDNAYRAAGAGDSSYLYLRGELMRVTRLPFEFSWHVNTSAQMSNQHLLGSEQMGIGGSSTVRGYDEREGNGDQGFFASSEIRTKPFKHKKILPASSSMQLLGFVDYGTVTTRGDLSNVSNPHIDMLSVGMGMRYLLKTYFSLRFDYGFQLKDSGVSTVTRDNHNQRAHLFMMMSY